MHCTALSDSDSERRRGSDDAKDKERIFGWADGDSDIKFETEDERREEREEMRFD
jgi:hypothetical protein